MWKKVARLSDWDQSSKFLLDCCGFYLCRFCYKESGVSGEDCERETDSKCPICSSSLVQGDFQTLLLLAESGHSEAQYRVGDAFSSDNEPHHALWWFRRAAENGHSRARTEIGLMYSRGDGVPRSKIEALSHWRRSSSEDPVASFYIGILYPDLLEVENSTEKAAEYLRLAAEQRFPLGVLKYAK
jgi:TPR repeat protein